MTLVFWDCWESSAEDPGELDVQPNRENEREIASNKIKNFFIYPTLLFFIGRMIVYYVPKIVFFKYLAILNGEFEEEIVPFNLCLHYCYTIRKNGKGAQVWRRF
jgi:hypothetical protein